MKILYIYNAYPSDYQNYLRVLLSEIKKKAYIRSLIYSKNTSADYNIISYGFNDKIQRLLYIFKISKYPSSDIKLMSKYDLIHVQHSFLWRKLEHFKKLNNAPKIIVTLRGGDTYIKPWLANSWKVFYANCNHITAFVVMSNHQKKYLLNWGVAADKIYIIPISFGLFSTAKPKFPNQDILKLVSAFRMTWEKNIEGTIRFAQLLKKQNIPFVYDIYGDGHDLGQLYYMVDRYNLHNYVNIKRKISNDELKEKLVTYDFFVQLSFSEALPTSVLEAQSVGLPCVISNSGGLPEAAIKNETALVGDFNELETLTEEAINLWNNKELYYLYSKNAILYVNENFSTEREIERLTTLYKDLLKK